ncbi:hypothetical protein HanRHA438_Chr13g0585151 [Helianthus annuus]|nr:hypothetical protein HanRHA438_Chr13g0585151 [Helianthus annuus]
MTAGASPATNVNDDDFAFDIFDPTGAAASFALDLLLIRHTYTIDQSFVQLFI